MITKYIASNERNVAQYDMYGLSTDTKPMDVGNASTFYEMDTCTVYMFDAENNVWLKQ